MATTSEEFAEIFDSEEFSLADLDKLREAARHGIPHSVGLIVDYCGFIMIHSYFMNWKAHYNPGSNRCELKHGRISWESMPLTRVCLYVSCVASILIWNYHAESLRQEDEYALIDKGKSEVSKRLRGEATRFYSSRISAFKESDLEIGRTQKSSRDVPGILESVITGFLNVHSGLEYTPGLVALCGPLVALLDSEHEIYYAFEKLLGLLEDWYAPKVLGEHVSHFQMLFLALIPDLYAHFEDEDLDMTEIGRAWFQSLLARELPLNGGSLFNLFGIYICSILTNSHIPPMGRLPKLPRRSPRRAHLCLSRNPLSLQGNPRGVGTVWHSVSSNASPSIGHWPSSFRGRTAERWSNWAGRLDKWSHWSGGWCSTFTVRLAKRRSTYDVECSEYGVQPKRVSVSYSVVIVPSTFLIKPRSLPWMIEKTFQLPLHSHTIV